MIAKTAENYNAHNPFSESYQFTSFTTNGTLELPINPERN